MLRREKFNDSFIAAAFFFAFWRGRLRDEKQKKIRPDFGNNQ